MPLKLSAFVLFLGFLMQPLPVALAGTSEWIGDLDQDGDFEQITLRWDTAGIELLDADGTNLACAEGVVSGDSPAILDADAEIYLING